MSGFFETIAGRKEGGPLMAAWIIGGEAAGSSAVFDRNEKGYILRCRDEAFPPDLVGELCSLPPGKTGILEKDDIRVFIEQVSGGRKLVICGAGHVSQCVIRIGVMLGFEVTVIEDREEYAAKARAAGAQHVVCKPFGEALDGIKGDYSTAFVIMTREHEHDVECLRRILLKPYIYAGMMGIRSRTDQIRRQMVEEGFDIRKIGQLHMPIGIPIGSRTPEEIAVSVAAELILAMNAADAGEGFPPGMAEELAAAEKAGEPAGILALITEKSGEAPRRPGTKMLIRQDGSTIGTVGGGYAEAEILRTAGEMIRTGCRESRLVSISMKKGTMHCGGEITVFLLPLQGEGVSKE